MSNLRLGSNARTRRACAVGAALALSLLALAGCSGSDDATPTKETSVTKRTVTATATGKALGVPDNLTADVAVSTRGASADAVLSDNNTKTKALLDQLAAAGIDPKDISTSSVNLGPTYDKDGNINGYSADNSLRIVLRDLDTAGAQLDAMVKTVGDAGRIGSIQLGFNDEDSLLSEARADAVKRARTHAEEMAEAGGAKVGEVRTITELTPQDGGMFLTTASRSFSADSSVPISAGSQELTIQVEVVFDLA